MNQTTQKSIIALALNILLPGSGYIYLKAKNRLWVAIPLVLLALYDIGYICFVFLTNTHYSYALNLSPFTTTGMVNITVYSWLTFFVISVDTWLVARDFKKQLPRAVLKKRSPHPTGRGDTSPKHMPTLRVMSKKNIGQR